ncbi:hypothetical protein C5C07_17165 [Haloferax sp. Atlit-4N]|nr:hypothetical protein C5C07_17165 [Haloferax sp. Atlit-4N]
MPHQAPEGQLSCYDCDHTYWFLGSGPHDGRCPRCGSQLVSPAGELRIVTSQPDECNVGSSDVTETGVQLVGREDSGRLFQCRFCMDDENQVCSRIEVCGHRLPPGADGEWPVEFFQEGVRNAAEAEGVNLSGYSCPD